MGKQNSFRESFVYSTSTRLPILISLIGILLIAVGFGVLSLPVKWLSLFPFFVSFMVHNRSER